MTQLANAEKAGYFPLPQSVSNQICTPIATQHNSRHPARCARPIPSMAITRWWKMSRKRQWPLWRMAMVNGRSPRQPSLFTNGHKQTQTNGSAADVSANGQAPSHGQPGEADQPPVVVPSHPPPVPRLLLGR